MTRRRVVLLGEDNAWTTVLGSFFKLLEVGVSSYLFYTLFKCFVMFVLIEAVSGRLIGSNSWNRSIGNFLNPFVQSVAVLGAVLGVWVIIY